MDIKELWVTLQYQDTKLVAMFKYKAVQNEFYS